jgi:uroporphyrinogen decarboxylase
MTKIERLDAVLQGKEVDRPPVSLWYHFGNQHMSGDKFAQIVLDYFNYYDFDFLKLMNDYYYPMPEGTDEIKTVRDLAKIIPMDPDRSAWKEQLKAVKIIGKELKKKAYFVDTVFDPWQSLQRNVCGENLPALAKTAPRQLIKALNTAADNLINYCRRSVQNGSSGIFMSVLASKENIDRKLFLNFAKPAAMRVFQAIKTLAPMNVVHIHGDKIYFGDVLDFPVPIISWEDRVSGNPSIEEMKKRFPGVAMGGIDPNKLTRRTWAAIKEHAREGIKLGGVSRFIFAGGCSIPTWVDPGAISAMVAVAKSVPQPAAEPGTAKK